MRHPSSFAAALLFATSCTVDVSTDGVGGANSEAITVTVGPLDGVVSVGVGGALEPGAGGTSSAGAGGTSAAARQFAYIETNDAKGNAVIGFERSADGSLQAMRAGPKKTGGAGLSFVDPKRDGPLDADQPLALSADGKFLFAVNAGSDTVAVLRVEADGSLMDVAGSPFPSNGRNPMSLGVRGDTLYVVNKAIDGTEPPNLSVFAVTSSGQLLSVDGTYALPLGTSPTSAYVVPGRDLVLSAGYFDGSRAFDPRQIDSLTADEKGGLRPVAGSPWPLPEDTSMILPSPIPVARSVTTHPIESVLYVGWPTREQIGVYTFDLNGALTHVGTTHTAGGGVGALVVEEQGHWLYALDPSSASVSTFDLFDPTFPIQKDILQLKRPGGVEFVGTDGQPTLTSQPYQLSFDEEESHLYVLSQRETTSPEEPFGNWLHTLVVLGGGGLAEPADPIDLGEIGVSPSARPQGLVIVPRAMPVP